MGLQEMSRTDKAEINGCEISHFHIFTNPKYEITPLQKKGNVTQIKKKKKNPFWVSQLMTSSVFNSDAESFRNLTHHLEHLWQIFNCLKQFKI